MNNFVILVYLYTCVVLSSTSSPYSFNIEDYGADPTGSTSSTAAIQKAINNAQAKGGEVVIPPGRFRVNETLTVTKSITISGINPETSTIFGAVGTGYLLEVIGARGVITQNFKLESNQPESTSCLRFFKSFIVTVNNLQMENCWTSLWVEQTGNFDLMSLNIWTPQQYGVRLLDLGGDIFLDKVHVNAGSNTRAGTSGLYLSNVSGAKITNSDFIGFSVGVYMDVVSSQPNPTNQWCQFLSTDCDTVGADPWHIVSAQGLQLSECWSGTFHAGTGIWLGPDVMQVSIVNHQWQSGLVGIGNNGHGVSVTGGIMATVTSHVASSVEGEPTISNLRYY